MQPLLALAVVLVLAASAGAATPTVSYASISTSRSFVQNCGQWPDSVLFQTRVGAVSVWFTQTGLYYQFFQRDASNKDRINTRLVHEAFENADSRAEVAGEDETAYRCNYFIGNDSSRWVTDAPSFAAVRYKSLYPGVDLRYYFRDGRLEYDYLVSPAADLLAIRHRFDGVDSLFVDATGDLVVATGWGEVRQHAPAVSATTSGASLVCRYSVDGASFGFALPDASGALAVTIDPVLTFSSYLGGSDNEYAWDVKVDAQGFVYVVGYTRSGDFPGETVVDTTRNWDIFVTKLDRMGRGLVWTSLFGGEDVDCADACALDPAGNLLVGGHTKSWDFPMYRWVQNERFGGSEGVLFKLGRNGNLLHFSTYLGGDDRDSITDVDVDAAGNNYACGTTWSTNYPTKNAYRDIPSDRIMSFATKLPPQGDSILFSTLVGSAGDYVSIAVDGSGQAVVAGRTWDRHFPLRNPIDSTRGQVGGWVLKLNQTGNDLLWSTFLSGDNSSNFTAVAVDDQDHVYLTGYATYPYEGVSYPLVNPLAYLRDYMDGVVTVLDPTGQSILFSTFWGGYEGLTDEFRDIAIDSAGFITVVGCTDGDFRLVNPIDPGYQGYEAQVSLAKFAPNGSDVVYSTLLGGRGSDGAWALDVDNRGNAYVVGTNGGGGWPLYRPVDAVYAGNIELPSECIIAIVSDSPTDVADDTPELPGEFALRQNYPNPFNVATTIEFALPRAADVSLAVYNTFGQRVRTLATTRFAAGTHSVRWDGTDERGEPVASGVYFCRLETAESVQTAKMLLLK